jgi:hypothetical protein
MNEWEGMSQGNSRKGNGGRVCEGREGREDNMTYIAGKQGAGQPNICIYWK